MKQLQFSFSESHRSRMTCKFERIWKVRIRLRPKDRLLPDFLRLPSLRNRTSRTGKSRKQNYSDSETKPSPPIWSIRTWFEFNFVLHLFIFEDVLKCSELFWNVFYEFENVLKCFLWVLRCFEMVLYVELQNLLL